MVGAQRLCGYFAAERHSSTGFSTAAIGKLAAASAGNLRPETLRVDENSC
jgi:hypothetical protein